MSGTALLMAMQLVAPISSDARLLLLGLADCSVDGMVYDAHPGMANVWTHLTPEGDAAAWQEIIDQGLLYSTPWMPNMAKWSWLTFWPGWEEQWAEALWNTAEVSRPALPQALRVEVFARDKRCQQCGSTKYLAVDHRHPVRRGGLTVIANLQALCQSCNGKKGASMREMS